MNESTRAPRAHDVRAGSASVDARERPVVVCLHFLGGSAREWSRVAHLVRDELDVIALDLPGFGDAANVPGYGVDEMRRNVAEAIGRIAPRRWSIAGHSMGAKVAAAIARDAEDGAEGLAGLEAIVLLAGSPPSPEPMDETMRATMLAWFAGDDAASRTHARAYVANNAGPHLTAAAADAAVADVLRADRAAWRAWLTHGSREDWSQRIGVLQTPTLLVAGADDEQLGPDAQRRLMAPHFAHVAFATLPATKHLLPLERPESVADLIASHLRAAAYRALLASPRVSRTTRAALAERAALDDAHHEPAALDDGAFAVLRAALARVIPQRERAIDLAARIDRTLAANAGDGWRFADLPPDARAYRVALATLDDGARAAHGCGFADLDAAARDALLARVAEGTFAVAAREGTERFDARRMRLWFEDLRGDAVTAYVAHPRTLERMGYSGIANGGDGLPKTGFARVGIGEREPWEPLAAPEAAS